MAYVSKLGEEGLVYNYLFTSKRKSHSASDMGFFAIPSFTLSHLELLTIELPKLTSRILTQIVAIPVILVDQFFIYAPNQLVLMKLVSISAAILHNRMESRHSYRTHIRVNVSNRGVVYFNFRLDIGIWNLKHMNEFVSIF